MEKILHMVGGEDEASYAKNSSQQRVVLREVKPVLVKGIEELLGDLKHVPNCFRVSDLGCSSGPNLFLTAEYIIESIDKARLMIGSHDQDLQIQYFLNDLVSNDFNLVFKRMPDFYEKLAKQSDHTGSTYLISAMPGSFYGKLFPDKSMHFQHSSYCLHWLSQVPSGVMTGPGALKSKGSIYCANTAPPMVHGAYFDQFSQDFSKFLGLRSQELVQNGQLLLTFMCKDEEEVEGSHYLCLLNAALREMVAEGLIKEEKLDSFKLPWYAPSIDELKQVVETEGSFKIHRIHTFKTRMDASAGFSPTAEDGARAVAMTIRAVFQPIIAGHFGEDLSMDDLFRGYEKKLVDAFQLNHAFSLLNNLVVSLSKL